MPPASTSSPSSASLLAWYDRHRRDLPWRALPGQHADPYRVWLSEIMLQQTQVQAVIPYFLRFLERWPTVEALAAADLDEVLAAWAGLGYYARARRLHACARVVADRHGGRFPDTEAGLLALPGVGAYTAGAIAAIAFDRPAAAVDGNVERVMTRAYAIETPLPAAKPAVRARTLAMIPRDRPGDFAQALMDLGATVCSPRNPACGICPWRDGCAGRLAGIATQLPRMAPRKLRPQKHGLVFWVERGDGAVLLRRRPDEGLLGGMLELPSTPWRELPWDLQEAMPHAPLATGYRLLPGVARHGFTHFLIDLAVACVRLEGEAPRTGPQDQWHRPEAFPDLALPTLTRRAIRHARSAT